MQSYFLHIFNKCFITDRLFYKRYVLFSSQYVRSSLMRTFYLIFGRALKFVLDLNVRCDAFQALLSAIHALQKLVLTN